MKPERKTKAQLVKELEALRKINAAIGTLLDPTAALQRIIDEIVPLFAAQAASVILFDYATQEAEITTAYGTHPLQEKPLRYPWRGSLAGWIAEHKRALRLSRLITAEWPTSARLAGHLGGSLEHISVLLAPLWLNGEVLGCLEVVWDPQRDIPYGDEQLLETIATQVAIAITNARLYQEKEHALRAAHESEERYRIVSQCMSDYAFSFRIEDGKASFMEWVTDNFTRVTGYPISDVLGKSNPWVRYVHPQDLERVNATIRQMQPGVPTTYEFRIIRSDGEIRWIRSYAYVVRGEKGATRLHGVAQDITERKHAEDVLRHQRAFEQLVASISKDFLTLAPEEIEKGILHALHTVGEFSRVDRGYLFLFREDLATMDNTHEWCAPGLNPRQSRLRNIPTSTFPWFMKELTDFEVISIPEVSTLPPEAQAEKVELQSQGIQSLISIPLVSGKTVIGLLGFATVRTTKRWTEESLLLLKVVGEIIVNALERKWAADRQHQLHAQLLQTQKLEAIGTLAGGIAHDFNNILAAIMGYTELATDDVPSESRTRRNLEEILTASRRARGLIQELLTFSRPSHQDRRPIQLHAIVENTLTLLRASFPKTIDIHLALPPPLDTILADPTQIEQVIMNLCVNAAYAIGEHHGVIGIGIDYVEGERAAHLGHSGLSMSAAYCLTVSDTGHGIPSETLTHIFEPFFTTKPVGQGSGMGLAIVHSIVTSHGGSITVESHPGQGTTFRVYFPPLRETAAAREAALLSADQELTA